MARVGLIVIASAFVLAGCDQRTTDFYVVTDAGRADTFTSDLTSDARTRNFTVESSHLTDDRGRSFYVISGHRGSASLWVQNMPMNSLEDVRCKPLGDAEVDPRQFVISLKPRWLLFAGGAIRRAEADLRSALTADGYQVLNAPVSCSLIVGGD